MTSLFRAADSILDAYQKAPFEGFNMEQDDRIAIAAALRATALYCKRDKSIILSLADELERSDNS